jgi:hypothetical protein
MLTKLLTVIMVLAAAGAAYAADPGHSKGFAGHSSTTAGKPCPCPCPEAGKGDRPSPCPQVKGDGKPCPCPGMKQGAAPCGKECVKKRAKCPKAKDRPCGKQQKYHKKDGKAPCFANMSGAGKPCPRMGGAR